MSTEQCIQEIWESHKRSDLFPKAWRGKLDLDEAYNVQLGLLDRKIAQGERQAGWKVGMMSKAMRELLGGKEPIFGYLLQSGRIQSGHAFSFSNLTSPMVEHEILITLAQDLVGPNATPEEARRAIGTIAPAFEIIEMRGENVLADLPLFVIDNIGQRAFVHGDEIPVPNHFDFGNVRAEMRVNGEVIGTALGREAIDNQLQTLAWLANALHRYGRRLEAGQVIMSGTFVKPTPVAQNDVFQTKFSDVGVVGASFA
jgi:2-keto-4-pentenoate hydratase